MTAYARHSRRHFEDDQQYPPVRCTRYERGNAVGILCTATQSRNACRVDGWLGNFWTPCGQERFRAATGGALLWLCAGGNPAALFVAVPPSCLSCPWRCHPAVAGLKVWCHPADKPYTVLFIPVMPVRP